MVGFGIGTVVAKVSGEAVKVSGEIVDIKTPTQIKTGPTRVIPSTSGGVVLHSGSVVSVTVKAGNANSGDIYLGGATDRPYSGQGLVLDAGEAINIDVNDFGAIYLFATVSGDVVTFCGVL
jgi:hypothetical protein